MSSVLLAGIDMYSCELDTGDADSTMLFASVSDRVSARSKLADSSSSSLNCSKIPVADRIRFHSDQSLPVEMPSEARKLGTVRPKYWTLCFTSSTWMTIGISGISSGLNATVGLDVTVDMSP